MPRKKSLLRCPICNESGQLKEKVLPGIISLPKRVITIEDKNELYRIDLITTLSRAWNYAAKIHFLLQENKIKYPPSSKEEDELLANSFYATFSPLIPHTEEELRNFENRHIKDVQIVERIKKSEIANLNKDTEIYQKKKRSAENYPVNTLSPVTKRIRVETDTNKHVSRISVACLYGSILFATFSKLGEKSLLPPVPPPAKIPQDLEAILYLHEKPRENLYAAAISQLFSLLTYDVDARTRIEPSQWLDIFEIKAKHGYRAASSFTKKLHTIYLCKNCSDLRLHRRVYMKALYNSDKSVTHYCNMCRGNETIQVSAPISVNSIKKREYEVKLDQIYLVAYYYYFTEYMNFMRMVKMSMPKFLQIVKEEFCKQEVEAAKPSFLRDRHWYMLHYDKAKKGKRSHYLSTGNPLETEDENVSSRHGKLIRKPHSIMEVKIVDQHYMKLVKQLKDTQDIGQRKVLYSTVASRLQEIGWPENIISQRIRNDIRMVLNGVEPH